MIGNPVKLGPFRLDLTRRELRRDDVPVRLSSRAIDILCLLAAANGDVVGKDEILARVWPGVVVEENNVQVQISTLRKTLEAGNGKQSYSGPKLASSSCTAAGSAGLSMW